MSSLFEMLESRQLFAAVPPNAFEQYGLELINYVRNNPQLAAAAYGVDLNEGLAPGTITTTPKAPLAVNPFLTDSARLHAGYLQGTDQLSPVGFGGTLPPDRIAASGYTLTGPTQGVDENLTAVINSPQPLDAAAIEAIVRNFFIDASNTDRINRVNLLSNTWRETGLGLSQGAWNPGGGGPANQQAVVAVQDFALSTGDPVGNVFLTGVAYNDADGDNFYDLGEGIDGVTIVARRLSDNATFTETTFQSGGYSLRLPAGTYDVIATGVGLGVGAAVRYPAVVVGGQNVKRDFTPQQATVAPPPPTTGPVPNTPNPVTLLGDLKGRLFFDPQGNGRRDNFRINDKVRDVKVYVDINNSGGRSNNEPFGVVQNNGRFRITGLEPGVYTLRVEPPAGFRTSSPVDGVKSVTIVSGRESKVGAFAITDRTVISGKVYQDNNFNGDYDSQFDRGLRNWRIYLDLNNDGTWQRETEPSTTSNGQGNYAFRGLLAGTYSVRVSPKLGFLQTEPAGANAPYVVTLPGDGDDSINRDFGMRLVG